MTNFELRTGTAPPALGSLGQHSLQLHPNFPSFKLETRYLKNVAKLLRVGSEQ